jgi:hypothetical protein
MRKTAMLTLLMLLFSLFGNGIIPPVADIDEAAAATPAGSPVTITYESHSGDQTISGYLLSEQDTKTVTFSVPATPGKVIKNLYWYDKNGNPLRAATGDWLNKPSFSGTDTLHGTKLTVRTFTSAGGSEYGGIYYWQRSGGSNEWKSQAPQGVDYPSSLPCPSAPNDEWGLKMYPNCTDSHLPATLKKGSDASYYTLDNAFIDQSVVIPDSVIEADSVKPVEVKPDLLKLVTEENTNKQGTADPSTTFLGLVDAGSATKTSVKIRFKQTFGRNSYDNHYYRDFSNPGARQMWYYSAFTFKLEGTTNLYKDKVLYVEWGDAPSNDPCKTNPSAPGCQPGPSTPPTYNITGDFDIVPDHIEFRQSFALKPKNFVIPAVCTYKNHRYVIRRDGDYSLSDYVTNKDQTTSYTYSTYPIIIGVGYHQVSLKITAVCDGKTIETDWIATKTLIVDGPTNNSPPVFDAGFFREPDLYSFEPLSYVAVNTRLNLRIINDPRTDPPKPYDPDGDPIYYTWDFAGSDSAWIRSLPSEYGAYPSDERHRYLVATELGRHCVKVTARDSYGASSTRNVCVNVVPENPIPVINGPNEVVEGRPLPKPFDGSNSFSPMGRSISEYIWGNLKNVYPTPGIEQITLEVVDSGGLRSRPEDKAVHNLVVKPDLPPVPVLQYVDIGVRRAVMHFSDQSYSPDGDRIVEKTVQLVYDRNNNGSFADDPKTLVTEDSNGNFTYTPTEVGRYAIIIHLKEDWGKEAEKEFPFTVVNQAPEADFSAVSVNPEPPVIRSVSPTMSTMMNTSAWEASSLSQTSVHKEYLLDASANTLETRGFSYFMPYRGITTNNVEITEHEVEYRYCGNCGNPGSAYGFFYDYNPKYRIDKRIWDGGVYGYYDEDRAYRQYYNDPVLSVLSWPGSKRVFNPVTGLIWARENPYSYSQYNHIWRDYIYRISDIKNTIPAPGASSVRIDPISSASTMLHCLGDTYSCYPSEIPEPPPPSSFTMPPTVHDGVEVGVVKTDPSGRSTISIQMSNFNQDYLGNQYKINCSVDYWGTVTSCNLVKSNASGQQLWQASGISSYYIPKIEYVSSDSSKLISKEVVTYGTDLKLTYTIRNNANGSAILRMTATPKFTEIGEYGSITPLVGSGNYYLGVYNDVVAYITQTVESGFKTVEGKKATWELKFYNLLTGTTTSAGVIKTYAGLTRIEYYDIDRYTINAMPAAIISADGKLIIANYYSNVLVYDMRTFALEADISTGGADPEDLVRSGTNYGSYYNESTYYSVKGVALTEDGRLKIVYHRTFTGRSKGNMQDKADNNDRNYEKELTIQTIPSTSPLHSYGYMSGADRMDNGDLSLKIKFNKDVFTVSGSAGIGFRSQDHRNLYRAEVSTSKVSLVKIANGVPTTIGSYAYPIKVDTEYELKVKARGNHLTVYINGVPLIDKTDNAFQSGAFGPYAEVPYAVLKDFAAAIYEQTGEEVENQAIVNMPITYNKTYADPENDPMIPAKTAWKFTNLQPQKFLDVGDGTSDPQGTNTYNGVIVQQPSPSLSKVGVYQVDLLETDDPAPSGYKYPSAVFEEFRKSSDPASHYIVVHRRPFAQFTLSINPVNHTVVWNDTSYDPDRWLSAAKYSTEATGIDYRATRGILERKYYYISPGGTLKNMQLIAPSESGVYKVGLAVKDEYGAWSDWAEAEIQIDVPVIDQPPTPGFTLSKTTLYRGETLTITSTASDPEDGPAANLTHEYYVKNRTAGGSESLASTSRGTWTKVFNSVGVMEIRQVVCDSNGQCAQLTKQVTVLNRAPKADFDWTPKPAFEGDALEMTNLSSDPDGDGLTYVWTVSGPGGYSQTGSSKHLVIPGAQTRDRPGMYQVRLVVRDSEGATDDVTRTIEVRELGIQGMVLHTDAWEANRQRYNEKHPKDPRPADWFWAGEAFRLIATVTDTGGSATYPVSVKAAATADLGKQLDPIDPNRVRWEGLLRSEDAGFRLDELPQGDYTFTFTVAYSNGTVKTSDVTVKLKDTIQQYVRVHRVQ